MERHRPTKQEITDREQRVIGYLRKHGAAGLGDIVALIGGHKASVHHFLARMVDERRLNQPERGFYDLHPSLVLQAQAPKAPPPAPVAPVPEAFTLPVNKGEHSLAGELEALCESLLRVQGIESFALIELQLAATHLERAVDWLRGNARKQLPTPMGEWA